MPLYPNPAGGSMEVKDRADAEAHGWKPSMGTFGIQSDPNAGGGPSPSPTNPNPGSPDLSGYIAAMQASSGFSIKQLEETKREFDATLDFQKQQWREQGLPELAIKQRAQDLEDQKFNEMHRQAVFSENLQTRQQDLDEKVKLGQLSIDQANQQLAREIQTGQLEVSKGQLGLDTLKTAASLSGPENWIQAANFNRGVAGDARLPGFVSQLLSGQSTATLGGPQAGQTMSAPLTLGGLGAEMGAQSAVVQPPTTRPVVPGYGTPGGDFGPGGNIVDAAPQLPSYARAAMGPPATPVNGGDMMVAQDMVTMPDGRVVPRSQALQQGYNPPARVVAGAPATAPVAASGGQMMTTMDMVTMPDGRVVPRSQAIQEGYNPSPVATRYAQAGLQAPMTADQAAAIRAYGPPNTDQYGNPTAATPQTAPRATAADVERLFGRPPTAAQTTTPGVDPNYATAAMRKLYSYGGAAYGPQAFEGLTSTEKSMMTGGGAAAGADVAGFQDAYKRSRIGQRAAVPAAAA